jgi:hypothetical protein
MFSGLAGVVPNFAIGAVLLMRFAKEAARYMPYVEIIETHHEKNRRSFWNRYTEKLLFPDGNSNTIGKSVPRLQR